MVSWGEALGTAVTIIALVIVWCVIGFCIAILIIAVAVGASIFAVLGDPHMLMNPFMFLSLASGDIVAYYSAFFIGAVISALGGMATILKYSAELVANEVNVTRAIRWSPQRPPVRNSSQSSKLCPTCGARSSAATKYCSNCGTKLE
jgi:uncharacterized membrane protein